MMWLFLLWIMSSPEASSAASSAAVTWQSIAAKWKLAARLSEPATFSFEPDRSYGFLLAVFPEVQPTERAGFMDSLLKLPAAFLHPDPALAAAQPVLSPDGKFLRVWLQNYPATPAPQTMKRGDELFQVFGRRVFLVEAQNAGPPGLEGVPRRVRRSSRKH